MTERPERRPMSPSPSPSAASPTPRRRWPVRRFVVADRSMEPTLVEGQGLIAMRWPWVRPGQLRCVEHPHRADFWLVKRVASVDGDQLVLRSDNGDVDTIDSRQFGSVPSSGTYRVVLAIPLRWM